MPTMTDHTHLVEDVCARYGVRFERANTVRHYSVVEDVRGVNPPVLGEIAMSPVEETRAEFAVRLEKQLTAWGREPVVENR